MWVVTVEALYAVGVLGSNKVTTKNFFPVISDDGCAHVFQNDLILGCNCDWGHHAKLVLVKLELGAHDPWLLGALIIKFCSCPTTDSVYLLCLESSHLASFHSR